MRYRRGENGELKAGNEIDLGTIDADVEDLVIVRYRAPMLLIRAVSAADGQPIVDFRPAITYPSGTIPPMRGEWLTGLKGEVAFEKQESGAWRTIQLLPGVPLTLIVEAAGFKPEVQQLKLAEGEIREVALSLAPAS